MRRAYWRNPSPKRREQLEDWLGADGLRLQYTVGVAKDQLERLAPDTWSLDWAQLSRTGNREVQIALFGDYQHNVAMYPQFQSWMREARPPALILWGRNDPFFTVNGARAYLRDLPEADLELLDGSHFLLKTHGPHAISRVRQFLRRAT